MSDASCYMIYPVWDADSVFPGHARYPFFLHLRGTVPLGRWKDYRIFQKKKCYICVTFSLHFCNVNVTLLIQGEGDCPQNRSYEERGASPQKCYKNAKLFLLRSSCYCIPNSDHGSFKVRPGDIKTFVANGDKAIITA